VARHPKPHDPFCRYNIIHLAFFPLYWSSFLDSRHLALASYSPCPKLSSPRYHSRPLCHDARLGLHAELAARAGVAGIHVRYPYLWNGCGCVARGCDGPFGRSKRREDEERDGEAVMARLAEAIHTKTKRATKRNTARKRIVPRRWLQFSIMISFSWMMRWRGVVVMVKVMIRTLRVG
jgi:hypothetical protein